MWNVFLLVSVLTVEGGAITSVARITEPFKSREQCEAARRLIETELSKQGKQFIATCRAQMKV